jgi:hypothetical protein
MDEIKDIRNNVFCQKHSWPKINWAGCTLSCLRPGPASIALFFFEMDLTQLYWWARFSRPNLISNPVSVYKGNGIPLYFWLPFLSTRRFFFFWVFSFLLLPMFSLYCQLNFLCIFHLRFFLLWFPFCFCSVVSLRVCSFSLHFCPGLFLLK